MHCVCLNLLRKKMQFRKHPSQRKTLHMYVRMSIREFYLEGVHGWVLKKSRGMFGDRPCFPTCRRHGRVEGMRTLGNFSHLLKACRTMRMFCRKTQSPKFPCMLIVVCANAMLRLGPHRRHFSGSGVAERPNWEARRPASCFVRGDHMAPPGKLSTAGCLAACVPCRVAATFPNNGGTPASTTTMLRPGCQWALPMLLAAANVHLPFTMCNAKEECT